MKRIKLNLMVCLCLTVAFALAPLCNVYALESESIHLVSPCDIFSEGQSLYVLDTVNDGATSVIHLFNSDGVNRRSYALDRAYKRIYVYNDLVYLLSHNYLCWGSLSSGAFVPSGSFVGDTPNKTLTAVDLIVFSSTTSVGGIDVDETYAVVTGQQSLVTVRISDSTYMGMSSLSSRCISIAYSSFERIVYALTDNELYRYAILGVNGYTLDPLDATPIANTQGYKSLFVLKETNALSVCATAGGVGYSNITNGETYDSFDFSEVIACDSVAKEGSPSTLYTLATDNKIYRHSVDFTNNTITITTDPNWEVGTNSIDLPIPDSITGCFAAHTAGYPTNILYEASRATDSVQYSLLTPSDIFLVCTYDEWEQDDYYLVYYLGRYGFVEKGSKEILDNRPTDAKLGILNTTLKLTGKTNVTTFVYSFPYIKKGIEHTDALSVNTPVTVTQTLNIWGTQYYYITATADNKTVNGWVATWSIGDIALDTEQSIVGVRTANPQLGQTLLLHNDVNLTQPMLIDGAQVVLTSGKSITVIDIKEGIAFVQMEVATADGMQYVVGYLNADDLMEKGMTDYQALGLSLFIIALTLAIFLSVIISRRKIKIRRDRKVKELARTSIDDDTE